MYLLTVTAGLGFDKDGRALDNLPVLAHELGRIRKYIAKQFGGYTEKATAGGWIDNQKKLIVEPGMQWEIMFDSPADNEAEAYGHTVADYVRKALNQTSVMFTVRPVMGGFVE